ncbi:hypothetical protein SPHINGO361_140321 [Sphingomonas sp. EC-HK361]|nr:hypothetical protein SPHINGO361_140321 [Sphingomonas sp. EC-HK361]
MRLRLIIYCIKDYSDFSRRPIARQARFGVRQPVSVSSEPASDGCSSVKHVHRDRRHRS